MRRALSLLGFPEAELSVFFVGSRRMRNLNAAYRGIDAVTDVLSFPLSDGRPSSTGPIGDVVVCIPRAISQSREYGHSFDEELRRLLIHGLLHLTGYDHERGTYQRRRMEKKEEELRDAVTAVA